MNGEVLSLVQACLGEISQNFRYIALIPAGDGLVLTIALEHEDPEDREAIEDIATDFEIAHDDSVPFSVEVLVGPSPPYPPPHPARVVWVRKSGRDRSHEKSPVDDPR